MSEKPSRAQRHIAPDFKRRQLIFDSFAKIRQVVSRPSAADNDEENPDGIAGTRGAVLYTWGAGYHGQLGLQANRKKCRMEPALIDFKEPVIQISCGGFHTAVLTESGHVWTWGDGTSGQLGNLMRKHNMLSTPHLVEALVANKLMVTNISCGQYHTAAVTNTGQLYTWGSAKFGQLGHNSKLHERFPRLLEVEREIGKFTMVACGDRHTACTTADGKVVTFGSGQHGQLGHGSGLDSRPKRVEALANIAIVSICCGSTITAAVSSTGTLYLWGFGESIHPKDLTNIVDLPRIVDVKEAVKKVAAGQSHVVVLTESGDVYTFGSGNMGQLGHGAASNFRLPRLVLRGKEVFDIATGRYHSMAVTSYGVLYSWGCGESGQLAHNSLENEMFPRVVEDLLPNVVAQIACGEHHSFCLSSIEHASVSQDVRNWKRIEDEEIKLKTAMLKDLPNGLHSKHILQVELQREKIIAHIADLMRREKEDEARAFRHDISSVRTREELLGDLADNTDNHLPYNEERNKAEQEAEAEAARRRGLLEPPAEDPEQGLLPSASTPALLLPVPGGRPGSRGMQPSASTPALALQRSLRSGKVNGLEDRLAASGSARNSARGSARGDSSLVALKPMDSARSLRAPVHGRGGGALDSYRGSVASSSGTEYSTHSSATTASEAAALRPVQLGLVAGFQPLAPRLSFADRTLFALQRVKAQLQAPQEEKLRGPGPGALQRSLFEKKKEYNRLKTKERALQANLDQLKADFEIDKPTDDDVASANNQRLRIKDLKMKLVTLNTRLMEAEENKKNYELYIIRMKEEDVQLSKQIDQLKQIVAEYERLVVKMHRMSLRVTHQKIDIDNEITRFDGEMDDFARFSETYLVKYRQMLLSNLAHDKQQESTVLERISKLDERRARSLGRLEGEVDTATEEAGEIQDELGGWHDKVAYYEKRFHKITVATGLSRPEDIVNKFFANDEITRDLENDVTSRREQMLRQRESIKTLESELHAARHSGTASRWKDVDSMEDRFAEGFVRMQREREELDRVLQKLTLAQEGVVALVSKIEPVMPPGSGTDAAGAQAHAQALSASRPLSSGGARPRSATPSAEVGVALELDTPVRRLEAQLAQLQLVAQRKRAAAQQALDEDRQRKDALANSVVKKLSGHLSGAGLNASVAVSPNV